VIEPVDAGHAASGEAPLDDAIVLVDVSAGYGGRTALRDVSLRLPCGQRVAIVGPNGSGKSTLLRVIAGLLRPWTGSVTVLGRPPGVAAGRLAYVPQADEVDWDFPVSVGDVVMMGRYVHIGVGRSPSSEDNGRVSAALEAVEMVDLRGQQIGALSGGQRRRAFLARAIAAEPSVYLLDEPLTGVDIATQEIILDVLDRAAAAGRVVIASTHDLQVVARRFDRVILLNQQVIADGPSSLALDPHRLALTYADQLLRLPESSGDHAIDESHHAGRPG
jgi:ABC-type Mn2+/Zn2+ transport system ATPase subunit